MAASASGEFLRATPEGFLPATDALNCLSSSDLESLVSSIDFDFAFSRCPYCLFGKHD
jgi:hypothetical protein